MKQTIKQAIKETLKIIEFGSKNEYRSDKYMPLYMFTTENLKGVINSLGVANKSILTVSASGDHIFNTLLNGAKKIECYDVNYLAKYYYYFKEAAIMTLDYKDFLKFFFPKPFSFRKTAFDSITFEKVISNIRDEESKAYWQELNFNCNSETLYSSALFTIFKDKNTYIECNEYLKNETNYKKLQQLLKDYEYKFYQVNIFDDLSNLPNKKYDIIYLSNILDRIKEKDELSCAKRIKEIINNLKKYLVPNGILSICYLYCYLDDSLIDATPTRITNPLIRLKYFSDHEIYYNKFTGFNNITGRTRRRKNMDALMLTRKKEE